MASLKGHFLVAGPKLLDPNFVRSVILLFEHNAEGAAGVMINRPTSATVSDITEAVLEERLVWDKAIHLGGPVPGPLVMLHTREALGELNILPGLFSTADLKSLHTLVREQAEPSLVIANYSGWGPGQLERELDEETWLVSPPSAIEQVFWSEDEPLWEFLTRSVRGKQLAEMLHLRKFPTDPGMN